MYHGLRFDKRTHYALWGAFCLFYALFTGVRQWERNILDASRDVIATCDLKLKVLRLERERDLKEPFVLYVSETDRKRMTEIYARAFDRANRMNK